MEPDRLQDITRELLILRRGGLDPGGRYPELMRELREHATPAQRVEVYASLARSEARPEELPCDCAGCRAERREEWQERVRESALRLMTDGDLPAGEAVRQAVALERLIAKLPEGEG